MGREINRNARGGEDEMLYYGMKSFQTQQPYCIVAYCIIKWRALTRARTVLRTLLGSLSIIHWLLVPLLKDLGPTVQVPLISSLFSSSPLFRSPRPPSGLILCPPWLLYHLPSPSLLIPTILSAASAAGWASAAHETERMSVSGVDRERVCLIHLYQEPDEVSSKYTRTRKWSHE